MSSKTKLLIAVLAFAPISSLALGYKFSPDKSAVTFTAKGKPALMTIKGDGKGLTGNLTEEADEISGQLQFPLDKFDTGIGMRNDHMRDKYLETKKFPNAELKFNKFKKPADPSKSFPFTAELTIKGVTKPVSGTATLKQVGTVSKIDADFSIKLTDYPEIGVPSYKGITIAEDVKVKVSAEAVKE